MTLQEYAAKLSGIQDSEEPFRDGDYVSDTTGLRGYWAQYKVGDNWLRYSVSDTSGNIVLPSKVGDAISKGTCQRSGSFKGTGFEATIRFDDQSYMLASAVSSPSLRNRGAGSFVTVE